MLKHTGLRQNPELRHSADEGTTMGAHHRCIGQDLVRKGHGRAAALVTCKFNHEITLFTPQLSHVLNREFTGFAGLGNLKQRNGVPCSIIDKARN